MKGRDVCSTAITQVPLIVRPARALCPAGVARTRRPEPVELVDLVPTICSLLDCPPSPGAEGRDLSQAILADAALDPDRPVFCEDIEGRMILHQGWMLAFYEHDDEHSQLYDLNHDPGQYRNRYREEDCRERRIDLKRRLAAFLSQRQYGPYTQDDVTLIRRSLDPRDSLVPLHTWYGNADGHVIDQCRCALFYHGEGEKFFIPFYDGDEILYFRDRQDHHEHLRFIYATRDTAVHCDRGEVETALNEVLRRLIAQSHTVSTLKRHSHT